MHGQSWPAKLREAYLRNILRVKTKNARIPIPSYRRIAGLTGASAVDQRGLSDLMQVLRYLLWTMLLAQCVWAAASGPKQPAAAPHPNIVLITLDTTRADRMGFLGSDRGLTPNLDSLARQSVVFTRAYSQVPLTTSSHATILTGTYPQFHKVAGPEVALAKDLPYLPVIMREH